MDEQIRAKLKAMVEDDDDEDEEDEEKAWYVFASEYIVFCCWLHTELIDIITYCIAFMHGRVWPAPRPFWVQSRWSCTAA